MAIFHGGLNEVLYNFRNYRHNNHFRPIIALLAAGARIDARDNNGATLRDIAVRNCQGMRENRPNNEYGANRRFKHFSKNILN